MRGPASTLSVFLLSFACLRALPTDTAIFHNSPDAELGAGWTRYEGERSVIIGAGQGPSLSSYSFGDRVGQSEVLLSEFHTPPHSHLIGPYLSANSTTGSGNCIGNGVTNLYYEDVPNIRLMMSTAPDPSNQTAVPLGHPTCAFPLLRCVGANCGIPFQALVWSAFTSAPAGYVVSSEFGSLAIESVGANQATCWGADTAILQALDIPHQHSVSLGGNTEPGDLSRASPLASLASANGQGTYLQQCSSFSPFQPRTRPAGSGKPFSKHQPSLGLNLVECDQTTGCADFIGMIVASFGSQAPAGWLACTGDNLPISQYRQLFALIGTTFGGDGQATFGLPDLRGRTPFHYNISAVGETRGNETITLTGQQLPSHSHDLEFICSNNPTTFLIDRYVGALLVSQNCDSGMLLPATTVSGAGNGQPFSIMQPSLALNYWIRVETPPGSSYTLTSPVIWTSASISSLSIQLGSLTTGPWVTATDLTVSGTLVLDLTGLDPSELDGFTLQLFEAGNVTGSFSSVTVVSPSTACTVTATVSSTWAVVFGVGASCWTSLAAKLATPLW